MSILMIHPRVEKSLEFSPGRMVYWVQGDTEARSDDRVYHDGTHLGDVLSFLLQYDWRGRNKFQEEENLQFLRMYMDRYPEIAHHFEHVGPTEWKEAV